MVTLDLPPFTLIGATTRAGLLTTPLRDRFGIQHRLEHYGTDGPGDDRPPLGAAARRRDRRRRRARDRASAAAAPRGWPTGCSSACATTPRSAAAASSRARRRRPRSTCSQVDHEGLDRLDREILRAICEKFGGGPVGLSTLAVAVGEEQDTIEDVYEPYLLQRGLIERTPRGRAATRRAFEHLGLEPSGAAALL